MKKLVLIVILTLFSLGMFSYKTKISSAKLNLEVKQNELILIFFNEKSNEYLYVKTKDENILLPINLLNDNIPYKTLNKLGIDNINIKEYKKNLENKNIIKKINNFKIEFNQNKKEIKNNDFNFCIYENSNLSDCKYVYFKQRTIVENDNLELALYSDEINENFEKELLEKWIDTYKIKKEDIIVVKLSKEDYNVLKVPEYYFK